MKTTSFEECWTRVQAFPLAGTRLRSWSALGRAQSGFTVADVTPEGMTVSTAKGHRFVPKNDFERIFAYWDAYREGKVQRKELTAVSMNTTYILTILNKFAN